MLHVLGLNYNELSLTGQNETIRVWHELKSQLCASVLPALAQEATPNLILQVHPTLIFSVFWKQ